MQRQVTADPKKDFSECHGRTAGEEAGVAPGEGQVEAGQVAGSQCELRWRLRLLPAWICAVSAKLRGLHVHLLAGDVGLGLDRLHLKCLRNTWAGRGRSGQGPAWKCM